MKLIDKDALLAQIERLKADALQKKSQCKRSGLERIIHQIGAYNKIISFLDTLEVKEVDLENAYKEFVEDDYVYSKLANNIVGKAIAKHFFELGLKAQKGK